MIIGDPVTQQKKQTDPATLYNTLPGQPRLDPGAPVTPPIDQGPYGPPPVDPLAPPPVVRPNVGEANPTPVTPTPIASRLPAPTTTDTQPTAGADPTFDPSRFQDPTLVRATDPTATPKPPRGTTIGDAPPPPPPPDPYVPPSDTNTPGGPNAGLPPGGIQPPDPAALAANTATTSAEDADRMAKLKNAASTQAVQVPIPAQQISPDANLIDQQISPSDSGRLQERSGQADQVNTAIAGSDRNAAAASHAGENIDPAAGERLTRLRSMQDATLGKIANGPDRYQMARDQFDQFTKDTAPEYDLGRKQALSDAANYGYTGSGRLVTKYGDLDLARERDLDSQKSRLLNTALEGSIGDRQNLVNTLGQFGNDEASYEAATRDELRKERANRTAQGDADIAALYDKGNYLSGAEGTQRGVEQGQRDEQRGERGYQRSLAEKALADQMDAAKLNDSLTQSEFERDQARLGAGYSGDPSAQYEAAAQSAYEQGQISSAELQQILQFLAMQKQGGATAGAGTGG